MKALIGLGMCIAGVILGIYVGGYVCFIGGIVQIIEAMKASPVESAGIAWGAAKVFFAATAGGLSAIALIAPGIAMIRD